MGSGPRLAKNNGDGSFVLVGFKNKLGYPYFLISMVALFKMSFNRRLKCFTFSLYKGKKNIIPSLFLKQHMKGKL